jgi:hypothetical protein
MAGEWDVDGMLRQMPMQKLLSWMAYWELQEEEQGTPESLRADYRAASIRKTIADVFRGQNKAPYPLENFRLKFDKEVEAKTPLTPEEKVSQNVAIAHIIAMAHNTSLKETVH